MALAPPTSLWSSTAWQRKRSGGFLQLQPNADLAPKDPCIRRPLSLSVAGAGLLQQGWDMAEPSPHRPPPLRAQQVHTIEFGDWYPEHETHCPLSVLVLAVPTSLFSSFLCLEYRLILNLQTSPLCALVKCVGRELTALGSPPIPLTISPKEILAGTTVVSTQKDQISTG